MNGARNLTQQDTQTPSHFVNEEIVKTITTTEAQRSFSPIQLQNKKIQRYKEQSYNQQ